MTERSPSLGSIPNLASTFSLSWSLEMWRRASWARAFECQVRKAMQEGRITIPTYLSVGTEFIASALSMVCGEWPLFAQHRAHAHYLCRGGGPAALRDELLGLDSGCARGMGGSASIHDPRRRMFGHSGLMGDQVPVAAGYALANGERTLTIMGDASAEEDYVSSTFGYAATKQIPLLFIVEDNDLSILTTTSVRRSWSIVDVASAYGLAAVDIADDPWLIAHHARTVPLPALINIRCCRHLWHAGAGVDGPPEWDRRALVLEELSGLGMKADAQETEDLIEHHSDKVWS